jgi:two-component system sensor histidine kinase BaeS
MRRRFTIAIIGTVLATLVVAGLGTIAIAAARARAETAATLAEQAEGIAAVLDIGATAGAAADSRTTRVQRFNRVRSALDVGDLSLVLLRADDQVVADVSDPLPDPLTVDLLRPDALRRGETTTGSVDSNVWAAAPIDPDGTPMGVVVLVRPVDRALGPAVRWFLVAAGVAIALAGVVAFRLAKQLTEPLRNATGATAQIAAGHLGVRLPGAGGRRDEVAELSTSINQMAATLERSRYLEQHFLMSVSHDLRTPLTSIRGYAEAVADGTAPDARAAATVILTESRRLERLVKDLLDLAKLDARQFRLEIASIDVGELTRRAADGFRREAIDAGTTIEVATPPQSVMLATDPDRLGQVLGNLLENAIKFATSVVRVSVIDESDHVRIDVTDDGPGIAVEDLPHVFERLYVARQRPVRAAGATSSAGSGLGLAIAHELVVAMGGSVAASAPPAGGTSVTLVLPRSGAVR